jgi:hypothetical protein
MREVRSTRWDAAMPYRGVVSLTMEAHSFEEANDAFRDLFASLRKLSKEQKAKITVEYEQTHERF